MPHLVVSKPLVPSRAKVEAPDEVAHYRSELCRMWPGARPPLFPGCNPRSVGREALRDFHAPYTIALKSDGVRYVLFLTVRPDDRDAAVALFVDRAWNMYEVEVVAPEAYFVDGTILDGELVWRQPREDALLYLAFDAIRVAGASLAERPFAERIAAAARCTRHAEELGDADDVERRALETNTLVVTHYDPPVRARAKRFVDRAHAVRLWADRFEADHRVDGVVLHRADRPYMCGTAWDGRMYKWKAHATVDLRRDGETLHTANGPLPETLRGRTVRATPSRVRGDGVVEFAARVTADEVALFAVRARADKPMANTLNVVECTIADIVDAVSIEEVAATPRRGPVTRAAGLRS